jgi:hypothetical protein
MQCDGVGGRFAALFRMVQVIGTNFSGDAGIIDEEEKAERSKSKKRY